MTTPPDGLTVVKLGGSTLGAHDTSLRDLAAAHVAGRPVVVVHGGGAAVSDWLARTGAQPRFVRGLRVTDTGTLDAVVAVLAGSVNKRIVAELSALGVPAFGLSGADGALLRAHRFDEELGFVGEIDGVDPQPLRMLLRDGYLPVVAPIAVDISATPPQLLNTNADTAAGAVAAALGAARLVFLTDVAGVLDAQKRLLPTLAPAAAAALIASGAVDGGMVPKLQAAARAAAAGCATRIIDGTAGGTLAAVLAGKDLGTTITA